MTVFKTVLGVIAFIVLLMLLSLGTGVWQYVTAPFFGRVQAERQIESGPSRMAFYTRFHDLCAGVQAVEGSIDAQVELASSQTGDDLNRTKMNIAGLKARRAEVIAQYNADASKDYTAARFLDVDLPFQLSTKPYDGAKTVCTH